MNLIYKGDVEVTIDHKKYKLKNHGTEHLFRLFANTLIGGNVSPTSLPFYIMLYNEESSSIRQNPYTQSYISNQLLNKYVLVHKYTYAQDNIHYAVFDTNITPDYRNTNEVEESSVTLALISQDKLSILAAVDFDYDHLAYLNLGNSIIIKWKMYVDNDSHAYEEAL